MVAMWPSVEVGSGSYVRGSRIGSHDTRDFMKIRGYPLSRG
jgi:hypothetical protein